MMSAVPSLLYLAALLASAGERMGTIPVWSGTLPPVGSVKGNNCNVAVIGGLQGARVYVRRGPSQSFRASDAIAAGTRVYVCNSARYGRGAAGGAWLGIAYHSANKSCDGATNAGLDVRLSRQCRTGWVHERWVTVLSG
jgi:hypothetical protein